MQLSQKVVQICNARHTENARFTSLHSVSIWTGIIHRPKQNMAQACIVHDIHHGQIHGVNFDVEYIYGFVGWGVCMQSRWRHSVTKPHTRWRICVTMATLWQQQDGGYMLFYIFNSTVVDWTCFFSSFYISHEIKYWNYKCTLYVCNHGSAYKVHCEK